MAEDLLCIRAGDPFRIPAIIKGRPVPKVTWEFDGKAKKHKKNKLHTLPVDSEVRQFYARFLSRLRSRELLSSFFRLLNNETVYCLCKYIFSERNI